MIMSLCGVMSDALGQRLARREYRRSSRRLIIALNLVSILMVLPFMLLFQWMLPIAVTSSLDGIHDVTNDESQGPWTAFTALFLGRHPIFIGVGFLLAALQLGQVSTPFIRHTYI
jgi:hypothetical protein